MRVYLGDWGVTCRFERGATVAILDDQSATIMTWRTGDVVRSRVVVEGCGVGFSERERVRRAAEEHVRIAQATGVETLTVEELCEVFADMRAAIAREVKGDDP